MASSSRSKEKEPVEELREEFLTENHQLSELKYKLDNQIQWIWWAIEDLQMAVAVLEFSLYDKERNPLHSPRPTPLFFKTPNFIPPPELDLPDYRRGRPPPKVFLPSSDRAPLPYKPKIELHPFMYPPRPPTPPPTLNPVEEKEPVEELREEFLTENHQLSELELKLDNQIQVIWKTIEDLQAAVATLQFSMKEQNPFQFSLYDQYQNSLMAPTPPPTLNPSPPPPTLNPYPVGNFLLKKTKKCPLWEKDGTCSYGEVCKFAHGSQELRPRGCRFGQKQNCWRHNCPYSHDP